MVNARVRIYSDLFDDELLCILFRLSNSDNTCRNATSRKQNLLEYAYSAIGLCMLEFARSQKMFVQLLFREIAKIKPK